MLHMRMIVNPDTLLVDVQEIYDIIETDLVSNASEVLSRIDYYTHKYRGDLLNDINVGVFINDNLKIVVQIYVANKNNIIKTQLIFSNDGRRISAIDEIINTYKEEIMKIELPAYGGNKDLSVRLKEKLDDLSVITDYTMFKVESSEIIGENVVFTIKGSK